MKDAWDFNDLFLIEKDVLKAENIVSERNIRKLELFRLKIKVQGLNKSISKM